MTDVHVLTAPQNKTQEIKELEERSEELNSLAMKHNLFV
jgi:hypothetical protein